MTEMFDKRLHFDRLEEDTERYEFTNFKRLLNLIVLYLAAKLNYLEMKFAWPPSKEDHQLLGH